MSELYSSESGSYEKYLSERQVDKITTTIKQATDIQMMGMAATTGVLGSKLDSMNAKLKVIGTGLYTAVSKNTLQIAASTEMLKKTFNEGFDSVNNRLDLGFAGISSEIGAMTAAMTAGFDQMKVSLDYWGNEICDKLDAIHDIVNNPLLTASRELYRRAVANAKKQFFEEALEDIKGAVEKNKTDYISWGLMGRIYLFGVSEFSNAIDVPKALEAFTNACKYISPDTDESEEAKKMAAEYYFYAAYANYILANESRIANNTEDVKKYLEDSVKANSKSYALSNTMFEALYDKARAYSLLEQKENALKDLEEVIRIDGLYSVKALGDPDFKWLENDIVSLITSLRDELKEKTKDGLYNFTNDYELIGGEYCETIKELLSKCKGLSESENPYLDVRNGYEVFCREFDKIANSNHPMDLLVYENKLRKDYLKKYNEYANEEMYATDKNENKIETYYFENKLDEMFTTELNANINSSSKEREYELKKFLETPYIDYNYDNGNARFKAYKEIHNHQIILTDLNHYTELALDKESHVVTNEKVDSMSFDHNWVQEGGKTVLHTTSKVNKLVSNAIVYCPNPSYAFLQSKYGEKGKIVLTDSGYVSEFAVHKDGSRYSHIHVECNNKESEYNLSISGDKNEIITWQIDKNTIFQLETTKRLAVYQRGIILKKDLSDMQDSMDSFIKESNQKREDQIKKKEEKDMEEAKRRQEWQQKMKKNKRRKIILCLISLLLPIAIGFAIGHLVIGVIIAIVLTLIVWNL